MATLPAYRPTSLAAVAATLWLLCCLSGSSAERTSTSHSAQYQRRHHLATKRRASSSSSRVEGGGGEGGGGEGGGGARYTAAWTAPLRGWTRGAYRQHQHHERSMKDTFCIQAASTAAAARRRTAVVAAAAPPRTVARRSSISMKARGKKGGRVGGGGGATATAGVGRGTKQTKNKRALYIQIEDIDSDAWRLIEAAEILQKGGVGVIPTDTCYTFACDIRSRKGVERILQIKNEQGRHKPLSLLCKDISTMSIYAKGIDKALFKTMKAVLPGPFTFILPSTNEVPRMLIEHKHHKKTWKRKEIGIRLPDAPVLLDLLQQLDGPLLCSSVPSEFPGDGDWGRGHGPAAPDFDSDDDDDDDGDDDGWEGGREEDGGASRGAWHDDALVSGDPAAIEAAWGHAVDFVVDAGMLQIGGFSTVVDAVGVEPKVVREGLGDPSLITSA